MSPLMLVPLQRRDLSHVAAETRARYADGGGAAVLAYVADLTAWGNEVGAAIALATYDEILGGEPR